MPGLSGLDVATRLRERHIHTPIIFISAAQEDSAVKSDGYDRGAVDFIIKPFDTSVLRAKVRTFVQLPAQRRELERLSGLHDAERRIARQRVQTLASVSSGLSRWPGKEDAAQLVIAEAHAALREALDHHVGTDDDAAADGEPGRVAHDRPGAAQVRGGPLAVEPRVQGATDEVDALLRREGGEDGGGHVCGQLAAPHPQVRGAQRLVGRLHVNASQSVRGPRGSRRPWSTTGRRP
jgi:CheY-like chemotaxis protein